MPRLCYLHWHGRRPWAVLFRSSLICGGPQASCCDLGRTGSGRRPRGLEGSAQLRPRGLDEVEQRRPRVQAKQGKAARRERGRLPPPIFCVGGARDQPEPRALKRPNPPKAVPVRASGLRGAQQLNAPARAPGAWARAPTTLWHRQTPT
ncbi:MAG: hypothetical protein EB824_05040 [Thaumarchaeota archaeon S15]|nr:MAG: hypothetical protein EB824_05040 [Thaumarchaeota archaeon S15]